MFLCAREASSCQQQMQHMGPPDFRRAKVYVCKEWEFRRAQALCLQEMEQGANSCLL
jgi:hypothetical protein